MTEPKIRRISCLSDGALEALRSDVLGAKIGVPMVLAWDSVYKALDEIVRLRERNAELADELATAIRQRDNESGVAELLKESAHAFESLDDILDEHFGLDDDRSAEEKIRAIMNHLQTVTCSS